MKACLLFFMVIPLSGRNLRSLPARGPQSPPAAAASHRENCEFFQALSENGRYLALTSYYYYKVKGCPHVVVWDTEERKRLVVVKGKDHTIGMQVYRVFDDGKALVSDGPRVFLFDAKRKKTLWSLQQSRRLLWADISDDGKVLATSSFWEHPIKWFHLVKFWKVDKARKVSLLSNMRMATYGVLKVKFFTVKGKLRTLVCEGTGTRCWVVDPQTGSVIKKIQMPTDWNPMYGLALLPSGEGALFSQYGEDGKGVCFVDFEKGTKRALVGHPGIATDCCILRVNEKSYFVTADEKGFVCAWEGKSFLPKLWLQEKREERKWEIRNVHLNVVHENGRRYLVVATDWTVEDPRNSATIDSSVELSWWDLEKKECVRRARVGPDWNEMPPTGKMKPAGSMPGFSSFPVKEGK